MKRREQAASTPDPLGPATIAILLAGWSADPPEDVPREHGFSEGFLELYDIGGIGKLWRQHEPRLREQARLWGWQPRFTLDGGPMFWSVRHTRARTKPC